MFPPCVQTQSICCVCFNLVFSGCLPCLCFHWLQMSMIECGEPKRSRPIRRFDLGLCVSDVSLLDTGSRILTAGSQTQPCLLNNNVIKALWDCDVDSLPWKKKEKKNVLRGWGGETDVNNAGGVLLNNSSPFFSLIIYTLRWRARVCACAFVLSRCVRGLCDLSMLSLSRCLRVISGLLHHSTAVSSLRPPFPSPPPASPVGE